MFVRTVLAALAIVVGATLTAPGKSAARVAMEPTPIEAKPAPVEVELFRDDVASSEVTPLQTPPEEQNPWLCYDDLGWERPCTATETYNRCLDASEVSYLQCLRSANGWGARAACGWNRVLDDNACIQAYASSQWPW
jgi:hypothetical protein